jgi:hypothetical protein
MQSLAWKKDSAARLRPVANPGAELVGGKLEAAKSEELPRRFLEFWT